MTHTGSSKLGGACASHSVYDPRQFSSRLVSAHQTGRPIVGDERIAHPPDTGSAVAVQSEVARLLRAETAGWKLACTSDHLVAAPIFAELVTGDGVVTSPIKELVTGIEVELAFRLKPEFVESGTQFPPELNLSEAIDSAFIGIELIGSRFQDTDGLPFTSLLADNLGNAGYVIGGAFDPDLLAEIEKTHCQIEVDGVLVFDEWAKHPNGDPLWPLRRFISSPERGSMAPESARFFTTGSLCGLVPVTKPSRIKASIAGFGDVECRFEPLEENAKFENESRHNEID